MKIQESGEMYLETILLLTKQKSFVRAIDVSETMGFSKPSVSRALGHLKEGGFLTITGDGAITLTDSGREHAEKIYERHTILTGFLVHIGVPEAIAQEDACKIEHDISDVSFDAIKSLING